MKYLYLLCFTFLLPFIVSAQMNKAAPQLGKNSVKEVIAAMTLEEKAHLVVGTGMRFGPPPGRRDSAKTSASDKVFGKEVQLYLSAPAQKLSTKIKSGVTFGLANDIVVEKVNKVSSQPVNINEYKAGNSNASGFIYDLNGFVVLSR
jgi:hypothetical protein